MKLDVFSEWDYYRKHHFWDEEEMTENIDFNDLCQQIVSVELEMIKQGQINC